MGPVGECTRLTRFWLALVKQHRLLVAGVDRNFVPARHATHSAAHACPVYRLAGHGGDAKQVAFRLREQVSKANRIVDVRAYIGIK